MFAGGYIIYVIIIWKRISLMDYMTAKQAAEKWESLHAGATGALPQQKIPGAVRFGVFVTTKL